MFGILAESTLKTYLDSGGSSLLVYLTVCGALILICACSSKVSSWLNLPVLVLFLGVGMLAGEEGIGKINFNSPHIANTIGSIAMAFILFSGGFDTQWSSVKRVFRSGCLLSSLGVLLTAFYTGSFTFLLFKWILPEKSLPFSWFLLFGATVSSTDAAAVFSILRSNSVRLRGNLQSLLEFESGSNDPMAAFLTLFLIPIVTMEMKTGTPTPVSAYFWIFPCFLIKMVLGIVVGFFWGRIAVWLFNKIKLEYDGLYYALGVGAVMLSFGSAEQFWGNSFMAIYVTGMVMGNSKFIYHHGIGRFHDGMAWLMQVVLFGMLGLLATPSHVWEAKNYAFVIAVFLMVVARPLAVFLCMIGSKFNFSERALVAWVGLRGGAPVMLATFPWAMNVREHELLFNLVFFIVLSSVIFQGMTIMPVAKFLNLDLPLRVRPRIPLEFENTGNMEGEIAEFEIMHSSPVIGKTLAMLGLPQGALVLLVRRGGTFLIPHGNTQIQRNDALMVLGKTEMLAEAAKTLGITEQDENESVKEDKLREMLRSLR